MCGKALFAAHPRALSEDGDQVVAEDDFFGKQLFGKGFKLVAVGAKQLFGALVLAFDELADLFVDHLGGAL